MPRLVVEKGNDKGRSISVPVRGTILVGRDSSAALQIRDSMASRLHIKIEGRENEFWLYDLESLNGTLLNGQRIREARLNFGDLIKIGETLISFVSDETAVDPLVGQRIGGYLILERVGRGGMGTVYRAEQVDLQRIVALKVMAEENTRDKDFIDLFIHEARAAAKLNHPNVVQVYDVKRHNNLYYIAMEFVSGGSVQDILNRQRKIPLDQTVQIILEAARGLEYAHKKGIVHRDVKPDNLMLSDAGLTKIGDMGLARGVNEKIGPEEETSVIGTPHYIAPEQVLGQPADFRSDIYSLGATMYRMLTGVTPFQAPSVRDLVNKKVREDPVPASDLNPEVPRSLGEILARMMARDPARRYQSMGEVVAALERWQKDRSGTAGEAVPPAAATVDQLIGNRRARVVAAAGGILLLAVLAWVLVPRGGPPPPSSPPGPRLPDEERARQLLELAQLWELKEMDKQDPKSVRKAADQFIRVMDEFPQTPSALRAAEHRAALEKLLRELQARRRLEALELVDIARHNRLKAGFQPRQPDLAPALETAAEYQKLAEDPELRATAAAAEAGKRAAHVRAWAAEVERQKEEFERAAARAAEAADQNRFGEAVRIWETFRKSLREAEPTCAFAKDRWSSLLYDGPAEAEMRAAEQRAQSRWESVRREAERLVQSKAFESALAMIDPLIRDSTPRLAEEARKFREEIEVARADHARAEEEIRKKAMRAEVERAREAFETESAAVRACALRYDFRGAFQRMKNLRDTLTVEEYRRRAERRLSELERADRFKKILILAINDRDAGGTGGFTRSLFNTELVRIGTLDGTIEKADETSFTLNLKAGGMEFVPWESFDPPSFYQFVKTQWKYNDRQMSKDLNDICDLAAVCMELGLYEEALKDLEYVLSRVAPDQEAIRAFAEEYRGRLERGETAECDEVEAQKRLARLEWFMASPQKFPAARAEIGILRSKFSKTRAVLEAKAAIDRHLETINRKASLDSEKSARDSALERLQTFLADHQATARKAQAEILFRLARLEDPLEQTFHRAAVYAAGANWEKAAQSYAEARGALEKMVDSKAAGREILPFLGIIYAEIYRIAVFQKNTAAAAAVRNEGARRFVDPDTKAEEEWWTLLMKRLEIWAEKVQPEQAKAVPRLREDLRSAPEDPQKIWLLATALQEGLGNALEARGYYAFLLKHYPDFPPVRNGECRYRLAEILYAAREVREATRLYQEMVRLHPEHPRVKDEGKEGVQGRLEECRKLADKLGLGREKTR